MSLVAHSSTMFSRLTFSDWLTGSRRLEVAIAMPDHEPSGHLDFLTHQQLDEQHESGTAPLANV